MTNQDKFVDRELINRIDNFRAAHKLSATEFGLKATNDRRLIPDLLDGRELRRATRDKILAFIESAPPGNGAAAE